MSHQSPSQVEQALRAELQAVQNRLARLEQYVAALPVSPVAADGQFVTTVNTTSPGPGPVANSSSSPESSAASGDQSDAATGKTEETGASAETATRPDNAPSRSPLRLTAYRILNRGWGANWQLRPAPPRRPWMDQHTHAYHCLPLVMANQWGWELLCPCDARVVWDGSPDPLGLWVDLDPQFQQAIKTRFGQGIVTFSPPWVFRTPPGWDLMAKGPANSWKENGVPLEGIVESWWLPYTFTFNWKLVEPGEVVFRQGEPIGHLLPVPHETFQAAEAEEVPIESDPELMRTLAAWRDERRNRAGHRQRNHLWYRKAHDVDGHLVRASVPSVEPKHSSAFNPANGPEGDHGPVG